VEDSIVVAPVAFISLVIGVPLPPASAAFGLAVQPCDDSDHQSSLHGVSGLVKQPRLLVEVICHPE
jgi:hypothetical protein